MAVKIIKKLTIETNKDGRLYRIGWFVPDGSEASYLFDYKDDASSWTGVAGTFVTGCVSKREAQHWLIYAEASNNPYSGSFSNGTIIKNYNSAEVMFLPEWFGIRLANAYDEVAGIFDIYGAACKQGSWVCNNATTSSLGSMVYNESPFTSTSMAAAFESGGAPLQDVVTGALRHAVSSVIYIVTYPSTVNDTDMEDWYGVNGSFGSGCAPKQSTDGLWLAKEAMASRYMEAGVLKKTIKRSMLKAPKVGPDEVRMYWDPDKNGGEWTW